MASKLACAAKTDVGLKRTNNEDNFAVVQSAGLYVLADGMGGHASGQVASTMCVSHVAQYICEMSRQPGFKLSFPTKPEWSFEAKLLANAIMYANERVFIQSCKDRSMEGMGTTVTAIFNAPRGLVLAHVGDSRIYRVRKGEITQMTRDHSLLNHLIDKGELRPEDAANFANKNVILRAIGLKDEVEVDIKEVPREKGDIYMMCSDGLSDLVADALICKTISEAKSLDDACASLIGLALKAGGKDNVTVVCVSVEEDDAAQQSKPQMIAPQGANMAGVMQPAMINGPMGAPTPARPLAVSPNPMQTPGMGQPPMGGMAPPMNANMMPGAQPQGPRPSMVAMPGARQAVPVPAHLQQTAPAAPQRMHSVREVVETKPAQRSMPKPIGSAGRSNSGSMPPVMQPARVNPVCAPETAASAASAKGNPPIAADLPGKPGDAAGLNPKTSSAAAPKEIDASAKQDKRELPETNLLFTAPPQSAPQTPAPDAGGLGGFAAEEDNGLFSSDASRFADNGDDENSDVKTMIECPIISDDLLHAPPKSLSIPGAGSPSAAQHQIPKAAQPAAGSSASQTGLKPVPGVSPFKAKLDNDLAAMPVQNGASQSAIYECGDDDDDDSIVISRPVSNRYMPPQGVIEPPKDFGDDDSIEISPDLYDDDEDSVTKTFKPTFKKW